MRVPRRHSADTSASMTPLIDVVFLLIIFFLVSSHLARRENLFPVDLPLAGTPSVSDPQDQRLTLTLDADGRLLASGRTIQIAEVGELIDQHLSTTKSAPSVRIRSDASVPYREVAPLLRLIALAGCSDIVIAAKRDPMAGVSPP